MKVYIELVILDNFIITYYIVKCVYSILKRNMNKLRVIIGSLVGTAVTLVYPFISDSVISILAKISLYFLLCIIFFCRQEKFIVASGLFLLVTVSFGGIVVMLSYIIKGDFISAISENYYGFPLSVVVLGCVMGYKIIKKISIAINKMSSKIKYGCEFSVIINKKSVRMYGLIDTGNFAIDKKSGLPIVLMPIKSILKILPRDKLIEILSDNCQDKAEIITALGKEKICLIKPDKFILYLDGCENKIVEVMIGVSITKINCDALLHSSFLDFGEKVC